MELCLGTAQLGMAYGINNEAGFSEDKSIGVLECAVSNKIKYFDTAPAYGLSEKFIGAFLKRDDYKGNTHIISKAERNSRDYLSQISITLQNLCVPSIDGYLFHNKDDMYNSHAVDQFIKLKELGLTKNIGVSVYEPKDALYAVKQSWIDYIQIPYNVLDQRLDHTSFFEDAELKNKKVFARSILLQGLLAMDTDKVINKLPIAYEYVQEYGRIISDYGYSAVEAALQFVKANNRIDYVVFGVDSRKQLEEFVSVFENGTLCNNMIAEMKHCFMHVDDHVIMPSLWRKD